LRIVQGERLEAFSDYCLAEAAEPAPAAGEVLIRVAACGIGYADGLIALGRYQVKPPLPHTPGMEAAGKVAAVGAGVADLAPGERVMAAVRGGFAQALVAPALAVLRIPACMSFAQAAGFRVNYLTALHGLRDRAALAPGQRLLVLGAAGGVGLAAVQLGRILGAEVIAAGSTAAKRDFAAAHGAHHTLDTVPAGWRDRLKALCGGRGPDVVYDPVCGPLFEPAFRSLAWGGRHLVVGFVGGAIPVLPANLPLLKGAALVGVDVRQFQLFEAGRARAGLVEMLDWVAQGRLCPPAGREFAMADFAQALEFAMSGQALGKTVLRIG
jgi:NADPH2:quinone reductase